NAAPRRSHANGPVWRHRPAAGGDNGPSCRPHQSPGVPAAGLNLAPGFLKPPGQPHIAVSGASERCFILSPFDKGLLTARRLLGALLTSGKTLGWLWSEESSGKCRLPDLGRRKIGGPVGAIIPAAKNVPASNGSRSAPGMPKPIWIGPPKTV